MPAKEYRKAKTGLAVVTLFMLFAGEAIRNLLGWEIFMGMGVLITAIYIVVIIRARHLIHWRSIPFWLAFFALFAVASVTWAYSPANTALTLWPFIEVTIGGVGIALTLPWNDFIRALGTTLRWILAASLLFELWVSVFVGHAIYPVFIDTSGEKVPAVYQWSRNLLLEGGPIQGVVGNRNQLGFIAVIALIVFSIQLAQKTVWRNWGTVWILIALLTIGLTRSATDIIALAAVVAVAALVLWMRSVPAAKRRPVYLTAFAVIIALTVLVNVASSAILAVFGKGSDLTGRTDIWAAVTAMAEQRPGFGWGWLSPWVPWLEPFNNLAVRSGVHYLQAHNVWLDVWMQLGYVGVIALAIAMFALLSRSWFIAIDRPQWDLVETRPYSASSLLPLLVTVALLAQSFAESQLVVQSGWALVVILSLTVMVPTRITKALN
ncbi:exopolysaccharide production protein ExoQ [Aurantimicrobium minutum]|uniref:O-antigen ligase family protein n=1 Tax=Aurantimicrobium minutum TaxID=708131 RepID=UPI002473C39A|nr:O-antigen ligase family protein [Aurantimicrobium minutum]MDH6425141.1 exopolysaccharide production protein ExoQ [Aurantimicrobium minutum]